MTRTADGPLARHDHTGTCWWCGGDAGSREHRYKATDLRREFAKEEYEAGEVVVRRGDERRTVRSPKADSVKFGDVFCARCNNERSQPFDRAYEALLDWYSANEAQVERDGLLILEEIDPDWQRLAAEIARYFVKHIGCRLADAGWQVPPSFALFLDGGAFPPGLVLSFEMDGLFGAVNELLRRNPTRHGTAGNLFLGPIGAELGRVDERAQVVRSHWVYHSMQMVWEWRADGEPTGTNLDAARVLLPFVRQKEGAAFLRVATRVNSGGLAGLLWKGWYGGRRIVGLPPGRLPGSDLP